MNDMLSSWNDTKNKKALTGFVERVTTKGNHDFVPASERIAVFDNDGTLWTEQPTLIEGLFAFDRIKEMIAKDPSMKDQQPFKAFLEHDLETIHALGKKGIVEFAFKSHEAETQGEFNKITSGWFSKAIHPHFKQLCTDCIYQPQLEVLDYLRTNGFKTFIVTGGGIEFVRTIAEKIYGIPPEQVIGSSGQTQFQLNGKKVEIKRLPALKSFDDREEKVVNINLHIGRRPVFVFGNSDGDLAMMKYALTGEGPRMALLLHHDDAQREVAYDKDFKLSPLNEALTVAKEWNIHVVSMKDDWNKVFPFE
jgi:phosphoglycolate phosphatase-like HAD superfamily hydrolase